MSKKMKSQGKNINKPDIGEYKPRPEYEPFSEKERK